MTPALSREVKIDHRVPQIDGLRAMGMLMVYFFHVWEFSGCMVWRVNLCGFHTNLLGFFSDFGCGVDLFMVISGFCLFWPLCRSTGAVESWQWRDYFRRRIRRIVPPYYAAIVYAVVLPIALVALYRVLGIRANWQPIPSAKQLITHLLFIHSLLPSTWNGITGAFWSLGLEAQFYVIFPLVVLAFRRYGYKAICWGIAASVLFRCIATVAVPSRDIQFICSTSCPGRWMEFGSGMLAALVVAGCWRRQRVLGAWTGTAILLGALLLYAMSEHLNIYPRAIAILPLYEMMLSGSFSLLILALCVSRTPIVRLFRNPLAAWLGMISYSLYLVHQPTAWYLSEFLKKELHASFVTDFCVLGTVGLLLVVAVAYPFFLVFERPGFNLNSKTGAPAKREIAPTAPHPVVPMAIASGAEAGCPPQ